MALHPYGEVLPRRENRVTVEGTPLDAYGVPIARIEYKITDNERRMAAESAVTLGTVGSASTRGPARADTRTASFLSLVGLALRDASGGDNHATRRHVAFYRFNCWDTCSK